MASMSNKSQIANTIFKLFRAFRLSGLISSVFFLVVYFGVFQVYKTFNPDLSEVQYTKHETINNSGGAVYFGNSFNRKVYYESIPTGHTHGSMDTQTLKNMVSNALKHYQVKKLKESLLYSGIVFLGLPFLIVLLGFFNRSWKWVNENRTI